MMNTTLFRKISAVCKNFPALTSTGNRTTSHVILLPGKAFLKLFGNVKDNTHPETSKFQRDTADRLAGAKHVKLPVDLRPATQELYHATWNAVTEALTLQDGHTRTMEGFDGKFFNEVKLVVYEVATESEEERIYSSIDNPAAVKQGRHFIQSLFRKSGLLSKISSTRMHNAANLVTPLCKLAGVNTASQLRPEHLREKAETLLFIDKLFQLLEQSTQTVPAYEFKNVFGGGELLGIMLFHAAAWEKPATRRLLAQTEITLSLTFSAAMTNAAPLPPVFKDYYERYVASTATLGRSGSKVVPQRAAAFKAALDAYWSDTIKALAAIERKKAPAKKVVGK